MNFVTKFLGKIPLRAVLIVPFVLQTSAVVGLVGYLSFRNGQKAINNIASQLLNTLSTQIAQQVENNITTPPAITQLNASAMAKGVFDVNNGKGEYHFWQQIKLFPSISYIYCGSQKGGDALGVAQENSNENQKLKLQVSNKSTGNRFYYNDLDSDGNRTSVVTKDTKVYDARLRPWYKAASAAGKTSWSEIYLDFSTSLPTITASTPVFNKTDKSLIGVCAADFFLPQELSKFLRTLKIGKSGQTFLVDRSGVLVSSSTKEPITVGSGEQTKRLKAIESSNSLLQATAQYLSDRFSNLNQIQSPVALDFLLGGTRQLVQVTPFKDNRGLDWLIVVVIPESDFMEQINANNRTTILLSIAALIVAIIISILTANWIARPILRITKASQNMAGGNFDQNVESSQIIEIEKLASSFNDMAGQLKNSFDQLNSVIVQANQVGMKVTSSTRQIAAAGKQLEATITQQAVSTNEVKATSTEIAATSGELAKTMEDITQKAQATASAASHSQASLTEMAATMHQLAAATTSMSVRLEIMNEKANNINSVVTTITKVADQTNLISLNASIEAEKAGEYGAGFAVVAREVRWLADKAALAASEIEETVKEIQSSVANGVVEMDKFSKQVSNYVERVGQISGQIAGVIEQVQSQTPQFEMVSHSMEGQSEGAQQISIAIAHLSESSQASVASLQETNQVLEQLNDTAQVLQGIISSSVAS